MTVTGKSLAENLHYVKPYPPEQQIVRTLENPIKKRQPPGSPLRKSSARGGGS